MDQRMVALARKRMCGAVAEWADGWLGGWSLVALGRVRRDERDWADKLAHAGRDRAGSVG